MSENNKSVNYFFVYQNKSYNEESELKYLWAPQKDNKNRRLAHWKLLSEVKKGDLIIHSHTHRIVAISRAKLDCYTANRPIEKGDNWSEAGWKVENDYFFLKKPILTSNISNELLKIQPQVNAPLDRNGRGKMGYFFLSNKEMFDYVISQAMSHMNDMEKNRLSDFLNYKDEESKSETEQLLDDNMINDVNKVLKFMKDVKKVEHVPIERPETVEVQGKKFYPRNKSTAAKSLIYADFKCEINPEHVSFLRRNTNLNYTEPHHLIPMANQGSFNKSLDTNANIVSLCSNCHNHIHYGVGAEKLIIKLYNQRKDYLKMTDITITIDELLEIYNR